MGADKFKISILGDTKQFVDAVTKGQKRLKKFGGIAKGIGKGVAGVFAGMSAVALTLGKDMVNLATDAGEAQSMFDVTFADALPKASAFVEEFAHKAGFAEHELQQLLGTSGAVLQGIDFTGEASVDLSTKLATLAGDVASFSNAQGGAQAVMEAMTKAMLGENESLKTYGIAVSQAEVLTKAFEMTGKTSASEITKQEKALATYEVLLKKTTVQQGDLNRTQDSFANKSRKAQAQLKDLKVTLGNELLPVAEQMLPVLMNMVQSFNPSLTNAIKALAPFLSAIGKLISALLPPIMAVVTFILQKLQPVFLSLSDFILDTVIPAFQRLPQAFEDMINKVIRKINNFFSKLNNFSSKIQGFFKKLGVDVQMPQLSMLGEKDFVSSGGGLSLDDIDLARELAGSMAGVSIPDTASALSGFGNSALSTSSAMDNFPTDVPITTTTVNNNVTVTAPPLTDPVAVGKEVEKVLQAVEQSQGKVNITARRATQSFRVVPL
tara:strand:- start:3374 stop:4855 length:1482 start_codon:yes stop_codon:yes gene_type:complete